MQTQRTNESDNFPDKTPENPAQAPKITETIAGELFEKFTFE